MEITIKSKVVTEKDLSIPTKIETEAENVLNEALTAIFANVKFPENATPRHIYDVLSDNITFVCIENKRNGRYSTGRDMSLVCSKAQELLYKLFESDDLEEGGE